MTTEISKIVRASLLGLASIIGLSSLPLAGAILAPGEARAVIGRPLTPLSYAGVARRTSRRTVRRTVAATSMTTLPPGCVPAGATYTCGTAQYQQVYEGGNVVYVTAE